MKVIHQRKFGSKTKNITADGYLLCDIGDLVISAAAKLIEGMSTNGKELDAPERIMGENETYSVTLIHQNYGRNRW